MSELLDASAMTLARWIRSRKISPREVVDCHIERIQAVNPAINAVIAQRFELARSEAADAERRVMTARDPDQLPPLLGLPYTAKEYIMADGMPISAGIWSRRGARADRDAETVKRLRDAGAILVGITNVPEGGLWLETYNDIYGRTVNPWDRRHTAGGSSGGEGAIVAAGGVAFGLGADVGGSIRIPAAFCGVVGHKPTGRLVPNTGFWPQAHGEHSAYLVCGPLTRRVEDVMPIMRVLAGPDGVDPVMRTFELGDPSEVDLRDVTVYPLETNGTTRVSETNRKVVRDAAAMLAARGAKTGELDPAKLKHAFLIWSAMMSASAGPSYAQILGDGTPIRAGRELLKLAMRRSRHTFPALVLVGLEKIAARMPGQVEKSIAEGKALQAELEAVLGPNGVILHPPYSRPAPRHYAPMLTPFDFVCTGFFNVLEMPSTVVPMGFDEGLPLSVQVIGRRGNDHLTIAVAGALERERGGWRRAQPSWRLPEADVIAARG